MKEPKPDKYAWDRERIGLVRQQCRENQNWRRDSIKAREYYDGNQASEEFARLLKRYGRSLDPENCIKRWVNSLQGAQEESQSDGVVTVEDNRFQPLAEALSATLKQAERMSYADRACLNAHLTSVISGIGWVEVGDAEDVFSYPHSCQEIPWREMSWDMSSRRPDKSDCEWFRRLRLVSREMAAECWPEHSEFIMTAGGQGDRTEWNYEERYERDSWSWRDTSQWTGTRAAERDMCAITEIRYRVLYDGMVYDSPTGVQAFDETNQRLAQMAAAGEISPRKMRYRRWRQAFWLGPYLLADHWNPTPNNQCGWIAFPCFTEERTGVPYGYVRDMVPIQDSLNTYLLRAMNAMDNAMLIGDDNRVKDWNAAREAVNRRTGVIMLDGTNPNGRFEIDRHEGLQASYLEMYRDQKMSMGYIHGLDMPASITGGSGGAKSGVQVRELRHNAAIATAGPTAYYREARQRVLGILLDRLIEEMGDQPKALKYKDPHGKSRTITVNVPVDLGDGEVVMMSPHDVKRHLTLDETPSTPTYRAQQLQDLMNLAGSTKSQRVQDLLMPAILRSSEVKNREMYAQLLEKEAGISGPETEEEAMQAQAQAELQQRAQNAEVAKLEAVAQKDMATAQKISAEAADKQAVAEAAPERVMLELQKLMADLQQTLASIKAANQDMQHQEAAFATGGPQTTSAVARW